jgi:hypothetical protein
MSKWFYSVTTPDGVAGGEGPFDTEGEANTHKAQYDIDTPGCTLGDPFEAEDDYTFPRPQARITRGNGTEYMLYTDGSTSELT